MKNELSIPIDPNFIRLRDTVRKETFFSIGMISTGVTMVLVSVAQIETLQENSLLVAKGGLTLIAMGLTGTAMAADDAIKLNRYNS